ncbi:MULTISPECIES: DsbA family protein [Pseudoalteromonas]|uniref:DsbA family protein n=1 Tax=Pseudoalteromonas TaxID=53246 RepID=UPI000FFEF492|nr:MULTISPECIES: DsbA family protein [Pseudoalteromonas]MCG9761903.1 DsbA family protein [Pseudoalteromonas sp. Isolate6]NKC17349.1 DsbA family oxidoreductase [Pseudoalteromonas galatheae]RXE84602.1 DsbA family oxidoreductase [Pseudoalteromonas sp. A757]
MNLIIEYVHDIDCSWCPINYANLTTALTKLSGKVIPRIEFLPYEVKPNFSAKGELISTRLMAVNGWSEQQHDEYRKGLLATAKAAGVPIDFSKRTHYYNTSKAHKLMHFASLNNLHIEMNKLLIKGYFNEGLDLFNSEQLVTLAEQLKLDSEEARAAIDAAFSPPELIAKYSRAQEISSHGVPAVCFNKKYYSQGSKTAEFYEEVILKITSLAA